MKKVNKIIQILCCTVILGLGYIHFSYQDAEANVKACDSRSYVGNWDNHVGGCWEGTIENCIVCVATPL